MILCQFSTCNNTGIFSLKLSHHKSIWCFMGVYEVVPNDLLTLINRLFTAILMVLLLFACQQMPESQNREGFQFEHQAN
ncbi:MAG: hypothetical protein AAF298_19275 [Cyanobacteria bacterium P01_A01_bin.40]